MSRKGDSLLDKLPSIRPDAASGLLRANGERELPFMVSSDRGHESYSDLSNHAPNCDFWCNAATG